MDQFARYIDVPVLSRPAEQQHSDQENELLEVIFMSHQQLADRPRILWEEVSPFQQSFAHLFGVYRDKVRQNPTTRGLKSEGLIDELPLESEEFQRKYGPPPWDFVNEILSANKLDFKINKPDLANDFSFIPSLTKISTGDEVAFQHLSSGEKVLISFAICLFNGSDERQATTFPKLLLLDEIDAPLHPSMVRGLLATIKKVLVEDYGVKVILTTHSPTTVALADEESLFQMGPQISKISKDEALAILTAGVPTLAISYEGRRQVFVESKTDAKIYSRLYDMYREELGSERSLTFIPVGKTKRHNGKEHEENSGCGQVIKIVTNLNKAGSDSVLGLIDWDQKNKKSGRVHVLCEGQRYSIENLVLDPVLLVLALVRDHRAYCENVLKFEQASTVRDMDNWTQSVWQTNIDKVTKVILDAENPNWETTQIGYLNGKTFNIALSLLEMKGHDLEMRILDKMKCFKHYRVNPNDYSVSLPTHIIENILPEYRGHVPNDVLTIFTDLLTH